MNAVVKVAESAPATVVELPAILAVIERAARDPAVDIDKMQRLFDMQAAMERRVAETAYNAAMAATQKKLEPVTREKRNSHTGSTYADLAAIAEIAVPVIAENGFALSFGTTTASAATHVKIVCDVTHSGGFSKRYESEFPMDVAGSQGRVNKTPIQAFGSTTTYGRRYMTLMIFNIATTDNDGNAPRPPRKSAAESKRDGTAELFNEIRAEFASALSLEMLRHIGEARKDDIEAMPDKWSDLLRDDYESKFAELKGRQP